MLGFDQCLERVKGGGGNALHLGRRRREKNEQKG
jgi:hypothetical protein